MKWISILLAVIIIVGGGWLLFGPESADSPAVEEVQSADDVIQSDTTTDVQTTGDRTSMSVDEEPMGDPSLHALVSYTNNGFEPTTITIRKGETVRFVNQAGSGMWVGSDNHPTHTLYDGTSTNEHCGDINTTSFDTCRALMAGEFWEFTFDKVGEWGYHNHIRARDTGTVIVEE